jgi:alpha-galactosidase
MHLTDEIWTSDNTDPFDRLLIQDGFTYAYTPSVMMAWVTDSPNWYNGRSTSLTYRFLSSMQGSLGVGADLNKWTTADFATAKRMIADYKQIRDLVQQGVLYRLASPRDGSNFSSTESVAPDGTRAVVFAFLHSQQMKFPSPTVNLEGLNPETVYEVHSIGGKLSAQTPPQASGAFWMQRGISFDLTGDYDSAAAVLTAR